MVHTKEEIERARYIVEFMRHAVVIGNDDFLDEGVDILNDDLRPDEPGFTRFIEYAYRVPRDFKFGIFGVKEGMKTFCIDDPTLDIRKIRKMRSEWYKRHLVDKLPFPYDAAKKFLEAEEKKKPLESVTVSVTDACQKLKWNMKTLREKYNADEHSRLISICTGSKRAMDSIGVKTDPLGTSKSVMNETRMDENGDYLVFLSVDGHDDDINQIVYKLK